MTVHKGETEEARHLIAQAAAYGNTGTLRLAAAFGVALVGLSHLWDGNAHLAEATLRAALAQAEQEDGRRGMIASLYAPILAAALLERDRPEAARTLLANRLDVIERTGVADTILLAYRTLARVALIQGDERRALNVLESLDALATAPATAASGPVQPHRTDSNPRLACLHRDREPAGGGPRSARRGLPT